MQVKSKLEVVGIALLAVLLFIGFRSYVESEKAIAAKDATILEVQRQNDSLKSDVSALQGSIQSIRSDMDRRVSALSKQQAAVQKSPEQAASIVSDKLGVKVDASLPDAPSAVLKTADIQRLASRELSCEICETSLKAQTDIVAKDEQIIKDKDQTIQNDRDSIASLQRAAKGGGFLKRAAKITEYVGVAGAVGYAVGRSRR